ncbi:MAG: A/G-specific adenine glycosylase [Pirellulaceae bacterium]
MDSSRVSQGLDSVTPSLPDMFDAPWRRKFQRRVRNWFASNARDLPWRRTTDPYRVWVSEVMLQQTQVQTVVGYYERFLRRFPDVRSLAAAEESAVLRQWEGLGYYRRARQMHRAAQAIVRDHQGKFPTDVEDVYQLPGIGRYTAHAILCFSQDARLPIVEANTQRLFARLLELEEDPTRSKGQRSLWQFAAWLLPRQSVSSFNQALMELGSLVCTPKTPSCTGCPVRDLCPTFSRGRQSEIPIAKQKMNYESRLEVAWIVPDLAGRVVVRHCQPKERWAGLWDFPRYHPGVATPRLAVARSVQQLAVDVGNVVQPTELICTMQHGVTKYRITLKVQRCLATETWPLPQHYRWASQEELIELPLNQTARKIARLLIAL